MCRLLVLSKRGKSSLSKKIKKVLKQIHPHANPYSLGSKTGRSDGLNSSGGNEMGGGGDNDGDEGDNDDDDEGGDEDDGGGDDGTEDNGTDNNDEFIPSNSKQIHPHAFPYFLGSKIECPDLVQISNESVGSNPLGSNEMGVDGGEGYPGPMDIDDDDLGGNEGDGDDRGGGGDNDGDEGDADEGGGEDNGESEDDNGEFIPSDSIPIYKLSRNFPFRKHVSHVRRSSVSTFYTFLFELCDAWVAYLNLDNYVRDWFKLQEIWPNHQMEYFCIIDNNLVTMQLNQELEGDEWERFFSSLRYIEVTRIW